MILRFAAILLLTVACLTQLGCRRGLPAGSDRQAFDPAQWKDDHASDARDGGPSFRQGMLRDVVTKILPSKTRSQIEKLLGPSLETPYFKESKRDLIYLLGPERGSYVENRF